MAKKRRIQLKPKIEIKQDGKVVDAAEYTTRAKQSVIVPTIPIAIKYDKDVEVITKTDSTVVDSRVVIPTVIKEIVDEVAKESETQSE